MVTHVKNATFKLIILSVGAFVSLKTDKDTFYVNNKKCKHRGTSNVLTAISKMTR